MLNLSLLEGTFAVCRFPPSTALPHWAVGGKFFSITKTMDELSLVCPQESTPETLNCERNWRCLKVEGPLDFSLTGVLSSLTLPLAQAGISIFAISTYDTDYLLVKEDRLEQAVAILSRQGYRFIKQKQPSS
ncbi:ACT domain-containing protein [Desulforamulus ruminis]|uniref:Uncharacterized protein n=1 Tax=Desulforamulus ruminis (strain ATCC 23193 / DSM 2154 / NCIMB 8452 / DL) TaxID=696281 RepID=F6DU13_DESRL|nr:ACT domain-containing protein [Desulforamulus ruminis]AEG60088.1 hypothetical protein Desru_1825 [Desulforamulus ruminis DSM 2154]